MNQIYIKSKNIVFAIYFYSNAHLPVPIAFSYAKYLTRKMMFEIIHNKNVKHLNKCK